MFARLLALIFAVVLASNAWAQQIVNLSARSGVIQPYFLARVPANPQAIAMLFPGSGGFIRLRQEDGRIRFSPNNFLVRTRAEFVKRSVVAAIIDASSDQQEGWGMSDEFRLGNDHAKDISVAVSDLQRRFDGIPLFLIGTSRGTISAASLGARFGSQLAGVVLTATMFRGTGRRSKEPGPGLSGFDFATIKIPTLFVHHVSDQCAATPYGDAARLADKYPLVSVFGGSAPQSGPCEAMSEHGFLGKESETVEQIVNWMLKKSFRERVE
jgi:hypothetical protein